MKGKTGLLHFTTPKFTRVEFHNYYPQQSKTTQHQLPRLIFNLNDAGVALFLVQHFHEKSYACKLNKRIVLCTPVFCSLIMY